MLRRSLAFSLSPPLIALPIWPHSSAMILVMIDTGTAHPLICSRTSPISCLAASVGPDRNALSSASPAPLLPV
ncbi:hypothetical protein BDP81DRAFT_416628 [Colletotrichum phormii]|uniref:Uncharacterized protein n=1 Tax=Colletotrichum phormii TaxID=359342 RepID=A0AAJ0A1N3_9PEZI|nr:uncharacterized protein BDP81DRAFT_416628 [Colletotrichum phormii]KAK1654823.1 hypothetical protein BDP81DRAFT_416628 [Colletotrichum phormii]